VVELVPKLLILIKMKKMVDAMVFLLRELKVPDKQTKQEYFPEYD
jgi:ferredoxin-NADP reductase